jgi:hypothetical protein
MVNWLKEYKLYILVGKGESESYRLTPGKIYMVGRHSTNDIIIFDKNVSRNHFTIQGKEGMYFIMDLGSKNGTFVEGKELSPGIESEVKEGIPIVLGMTILGLGEDYRSYLKTFLDSAGFSAEVNEYGMFNKPLRVKAVKKNMEFIYNMNRFLMESKDHKEIFNRLLDGIFDLFKRIDRCVIITIDDQTGEFSNIMYRSRKPVDDPNKVYNRELVGKALMMNAPVMVKDSNIMEDGDEKVTESLQLMNIRSAMCVPIKSLYSLKGVIYVDSLSRPKGFRKNDLALLQDISGRAALAMDNISLKMPNSLEDRGDVLRSLNNSNTRH